MCSLECMYTCSSLDYMFNNDKWESLVLSKDFDTRNPVDPTQNQLR